MVENEETFDRILPSFLKWLQNTENDFGRNMTKTFIICGDWDLRIMLPDQCQMSNITVPPVMTQWLNLKKVNYKFILYLITIGLLRAHKFRSMKTKRWHSEVQTFC